MKKSKELMQEILKWHRRRDIKVIRWKQKIVSEYICIEHIKKVLNNYIILWKKNKEKNIWGNTKKAEDYKLN